MGTIHTHYDNLKVTKDAPFDVIKAAYRALALKHHPDCSQMEDAENVMRLLNVAYEVLGDPIKRAEYDLWLDKQEKLSEEKVSSVSFNEPGKKYVIIVTPDNYRDEAIPLVSWLNTRGDYSPTIWTVNEYARNEITPSETCFVLFLGHPDENSYVNLYYPRMNFKIVNRAGIYYAWDKKKGIIFGDGDISHKSDLISFSQEIRDGIERDAKENKLSMTPYILFGLCAFNPITGILSLATSVFLIARMKIAKKQMQKSQVGVGVEKFMSNYF